MNSAGRYNDPQSMQHAHLPVMCVCEVCQCACHVYCGLFVSFWRTRCLNRRPGASHLYSEATGNWLKKQKKTLPLPRDDRVGSSAISAWSFVIQCYPVLSSDLHTQLENAEVVKNTLKVVH